MSKAPEGQGVGDREENTMNWPWKSGRRQGGVVKDSGRASVWMLFSATAFCPWISTVYLTFPFCLKREHFWILIGSHKTHIPKASLLNYWQLCQAVGYHGGTCQAGEAGKAEVLEYGRAGFQGTAWAAAEAGMALRWGREPGEKSWVPVGWRLPSCLQGLTQSSHKTGFGWWIG